MSTLISIPPSFESMMGYILLPPVVGNFDASRKGAGQKPRRSVVFDIVFVIKTRQLRPLNLVDMRFSKDGASISGI